ncbi:hypothetical protein C1645_832936 [Glomus cerebriforme]|uniref:Uncharacterized protein n=1 Tax=Glomus cerebriforme TaxID=658196 RepID=A0A397SDD0_9GLOM|nr:hypothetical protein C1645_832936 [Glomus cerebriforme]
MLKVNRSIIKNLNKKEIDWVKTLNYILNKEEGGNELTSTKDSSTRTYNIKNIIKKLPTYQEMERRNNEIYNDKCPRCRLETETWTHVWQCDKNESKIQDLIMEEMDLQIEELKKEILLSTKINGKIVYLKFLLKD